MLSRVLGATCSRSSADQGRALDTDFLSPSTCISRRETDFYCVGRMKALLFTLIRAFEIRFTVPPNEIGKKSSVVQRPVLVKDMKGGSQLPLLVTPYVHAH